MKLTKFFLCLVFITMVNSCGIFDTRTPENPNDTNLNFPPATSPQILLDNFINSIHQKNATIYQSCFFSDGNQYIFFPSYDALAIYSNIFQNWNLASEFNFAKNLFSKFNPEEYPIFNVSRHSFSNVSTDSTIFIGDYEISIYSRDNSINNLYKGKIQLNLILDKTGTWKIIRWYDYKQEDNFPTISFLKAKLNS
ncbi:MAG: hypothetical protein ACK42Z_04140 [Candidatus Kapaibacteriota bacterium]